MFEKTELDRISNVDSVSGEFTGTYAIHPFSKEKNSYLDF